MAAVLFTRRDSEVMPFDDSCPATTTDGQVLLLQLAKRHLRKTPLFKDVNSDKEIEEELRRLDVWQPPSYIQQNFPYYFTGRSYSGGPLWIVEAGKFDLRTLLNQSPDVVESVERSLVQVFTFLVKSMTINEQRGRTCRVQAILDFEGMSFWKIGTPSSIALILRLCTRYKDVVDEILHEAYLINVNSVVEMILRRASPLLGQLMKKLRVYGRNDKSWMDKIQDKFPPSSVPESYGGTFSCVTTF